MIIICLTDLGSNDSYSTVANMTMEGGESGAPSPRGAPSFLPAPGSPSFLPPGHSPPPHHGPPPHHVPPGWDHAMGVFALGAYYKQSTLYYQLVYFNFLVLAKCYPLLL